MTRITAEFGLADWDDVQVGDVFELQAQARVTAVEEELVDVTSLGQAPPSLIPAGRSVRLFITHAVRRRSED